MTEPGEKKLSLIKKSDRYGDQESDRKGQQSSQSSQNSHGKSMIEGINKDLLDEGSESENSAQNRKEDQSPVGGASPSSIFGRQKSTKGDDYIEPAFNKPGYVDGALKPYRGRNMDSFCRNLRLSLFDPEIDLFNLKNPRLQFIFNNERDDLHKSFLDLKKQTDDKEFKFEVMIAFWLCVELGHVEEAACVVRMDPFIQKVVINLRENGNIMKRRKILLEKKRLDRMNAFNGTGKVNMQAKDADKDSQDSQGEESGENQDGTGKNKKDKFDPDDPLGENKKRIDVTEAEYGNVAMSESRDVEAIERGKYDKFKAIIQSKANEKLPVLKSQEELEDEAERLLKQKVTAKIRDRIELAELKDILRSKVGTPFCTNVLRIALNRKEEVIASVIIANYHINLDEKMIIRAIKTNQMQFLYCVWAFNKNYERQLNVDKLNQSEDSSEMSSEDSQGNQIPYNSQKYRSYTYDFLFKKILEFCPDDYVPRIRQIASWGLKSSENFLLSLLINRQDVIAIDKDFIKLYQQDATFDLMVFAIRNQNEVFLKHALQDSIFGSDFFENQKVREEILSNIELKAKTEFYLNLLLYADFSRWPQRDLDLFITFLEEITCEPHEKNRIVLSYNPILTICLASCHLEQIGEKISVFKHRGQKLIQGLLDLGACLVENIETESIHAIFMDTDFQDRTTLHIITYQGYAPLMTDDKVSVLLDQLWQGKLTYDCDGRISDFSKLTYMVAAPVKKLPGQKIGFLEILSNTFEPNINEESYAVQYKFRKSSINVIFMQNFLSSVAIVGLFTYINIQYQNLFAASQTTGMTNEQKIAKISENLKEFSTLVLMGNIVSFSCLISVIAQLVFNLFSKFNLPFDKWSMFDFANAISNAICFNLFNQLTPEQIAVPTTKRTFNIFQVICVTISWLRFSSFCLVIQSISLLIMTLIKMVVKAMPFVGLSIIYIVMVVPCFQLIFQEETVVYIDFMSTARTLFDAMLGNYGFYVGSEFKGETHNIFMVGHIFVSNIFLLNYLIAILATVYEQMEEQGDFAYKSNKYQYIERYAIAQQDKWGYTELVVHPPPINYLTVFLLPSVFRQGMMMRTAEIYSKIIFWLENLYYIVTFLLYELILVPLIYLRLIFNILRVETNICNAIGLSLAWLIIGPFYLLLGLIQDMYYYNKVLCDYHEDDNAATEKQVEDELQDNIVIYNEVVDTIRAIMNVFKYKKARKLVRKNKKVGGGAGGAGPSPKKVHKEFGIKKEDEGEGDPLLRASNKFDLLEELQRQNEDRDDDEGYTINKDLILKAWKRFRPVNKEFEENEQSPAQRRKKPRTQQVFIKEIFGKIFTSELMRGIHLKLYNFQETEKQVKQRAEFKSEFSQYYAEKFEELNKYYGHLDEIQQEREDNVPEDEVEIVNGFLEKFMFETDSKHQNQIDLCLTLKALPCRVDEFNCYRMTLFDFPMQQLSIIANQNTDQDELFKFYDNRNKTRLRKLRTKATSTEAQTQELLILASTVLSVLKGILAKANMKSLHNKKVAEFRAQGNAQPDQMDGKEKEKKKKKGVKALDKLASKTNKEGLSKKKVEKKKPKSAKGATENKED